VPSYSTEYVVLLNKLAEAVTVLIGIRVCRVDSQQGHQLFLTDVFIFFCCFFGGSDWFLSYPVWYLTHQPDSWSYV